MSITPTSVRFNLDLPARNSTGPINDFGQHKFVVLRKLAELQPTTRAQLLTALIMSDAQATSALEKLLEAGMAAEGANQVLAITELGRQQLEKL